MTRYEFETVDVFTDTRFGGNPLAVFPDARGMEATTMAALAREFNLSETSFVLPPDDPAHRARVRIFGPREELPFAGHPNVGTAFVLARREAAAPARYVFEELAGLVAVELLRDGAGRVGGARVAAPLPLRLGAEVSVALIAAGAGLAAEEIRTALHAPVIASVGTAFAIAEVADAALDRAGPELGALRAAAARFPEAPGFKLLLHSAPAGEDGRRRARMFAPLTGVVEDAATGSAAAALAALLLARGGGGTVVVDQGAAIGRPSRIEARATRAADGAIMASVAGACVPVMRGEVAV